DPPPLHCTRSRPALTASEGVGGRIMRAMQPSEPNAEDDRPNKLGTPVSGKHRRKWPFAAAGLVVIAAGVAWWWSDAAKKQDAQAARRPAGAIAVVTAKAESRDVPV